MPAPNVKGVRARRWATVSEVAALSGIPERTLRRWAENGEIVAKKKIDIWHVDLLHLRERLEESEAVEEERRIEATHENPVLSLFLEETVGHNLGKGREKDFLEGGFSVGDLRLIERRSKV
jgi:hypothetical protein